MLSQGTFWFEAFGAKCLSGSQSFPAVLQLKFSQDFDVDVCFDVKVLLVFIEFADFGENMPWCVISAAIFILLTMSFLNRKTT